MTPVTTFANRPDFPFEHYFEDVQHFIAAQEYWAAVLRSVPQFHDAQWQPKNRPVDIEDDMYTGLVVDIENMERLKSIRIYTRSVAGYANFNHTENLQTIEAMAAHKTDMPPPPNIPQISTHYAENKAQAELELAENAGFETGIEPHEFFDPEAEEKGLDPFRPGKQMVLISTITNENRQMATDALRAFITL